MGARVTELCGAWQWVMNGLLCGDVALWRLWGFMAPLSPDRCSPGCTLVFLGKGPRVSVLGFCWCTHAKKQILQMWKMSLWELASLGYDASICKMLCPLHPPRMYKQNQKSIIPPVSAFLATLAIPSHVSMCSQEIFQIQVWGTYFKP